MAIIYILIIQFLSIPPIAYTCNSAMFIFMSLHCDILIMKDLLDDMEDMIFLYYLIKYRI